MRNMKIFFVLCMIFIAFSANPIFASEISSSDKPDGFASIGINDKKNFAGNKTVVVNNASDLKKYASMGNYIIYVDGIIDISEGLLPKSATEGTEALDAWIADISDAKISSWKAWRETYAAACETSSDKKSNDASLDDLQKKFVTAWRDIIKINVASNTSIIGLKENCGLKACYISIDSVSNVALRNLELQDGFDPFPHHEDNDGWNAEYDLVSIKGSSKNIWLDHCTLQDTVTVGLDSYAHVKNASGLEEKWQTYDGLCDIKGSIKNITISYCKFYNHDKTMLFGSSDSEKFEGVRTVTLHHNYIINCVQRLPMVRLMNVHSYNNYFDFEENSAYKSNYVLGVRYNSNIIAENNYYGSGINYSYSGSSSKKGNVYSSGEIDKSANKRKDGQFEVSAEKLFKIPYKYHLDKADNLKNILPVQCGAGVLPVKQ